MSARVLITGGSGFVGRHLVAACAADGERVYSVSRRAGAEAPAAVERGAVDLLDPAATRAAVRDAAPERVFHLAALASVGRSWEDPARTIDENVRTTLSVLDAVRLEAPGARVLVASSGEVYGPPRRLPVDEEAPLRPQNPYAVSKATADLLAGMYADAHRVHVIRARAFNHAGPGQTASYVIAALARQVAAGALAGEDPVPVRTGNPDARRDFTDVRDVVRAYRLLAAEAEPGAYNVCSGRAVSVAEIVAALGECAGVRVLHEVDPALLRPTDVPELRGDHARLTAATGWVPEIPLARTLGDTVAWWSSQLAGRGVDSVDGPE